jgi:predicted enzyme related to lactoylglutathione lyase
LLVGCISPICALLAPFYVEVAELEPAVSRIEDLGGKRVMGLMDVPGGPSIALIADPEGHVVGLVEAGSRRGGR